MSRISQQLLNSLPPDEARVYFASWSADIQSRSLLTSLAVNIYRGSGNVAENEAVASLMHAEAYLRDRIGYEMEPHPKNMVRRL